MGVQIVPAIQGHVSDLGRIYYESFKELADLRNTPLGFPDSAAAAQDMYSSLITQDFARLFVVLSDDRPAGSAWLRLADEVAAIEDVNVSPDFQGRGIGRALTKHLIDYAHVNNFDRIRLTQSTANPIALSLYSSLGFEVRDAFVEMQAAPSTCANNSVRPLERADLSAIEVLSRRIYKVSRRKDVEAAMKLGSGVLVLDQGNRLAGYLVFDAVFSGHGVAEAEEDALALIGEAARRSPGGVEFNCPLSLSNFLRKALKTGNRAKIIHTIMAIGPYDHPEGVWMPSGAY